MVDLSDIYTIGLPGNLNKPATGNGEVLPGNYEYVHPVC